MSLPVGASAPLFKNERATRERVEKFISEHEWTDCNLHGARYSHARPVQLRHVDAGLHRPSFHDATSREATAVRVGFSGIGPTWSTHWFHVSFSIPPEWEGSDALLLWDSGCEAMVWSADGRPLQGLSSHYKKTQFRLTQKPGSSVEFWVEVAANNVVGVGKGGMINPPDEQKFYTLSKAEICIANPDVLALIRDLEVITKIVANLPKESHQRSRAMFVGNSMVTMCRLKDPASLRAAHQMATDFFAQGNGPNVFQLHAVGNCHIDTAWLWTYAETRRKVARSWVTALRLCERYPDLTFAISQAVQVSWLREDYPSLFAEVAAAVASGRFVVVGGLWVEMDGNIPSGESFVRQMLYGQKEFRESFGKDCDIFWLPDTFGYSAQLPQMMKQANMTKFLTQKLSWNLVNKFPHHSFIWEGIDGSDVLTHFPPCDNYTCEVDVKEIVHSSNNFEDKGRSSSAILLYGHGDGGGGPSEEMMERLSRLRDVAELPPVKPSSPTDFFRVLASESGQLSRWRGELYLELHNGTYTTQAAVKARNRASELRLRDVECLDALRRLHGGKTESWESSWKSVLLNQFHDVLPGTSIAAVYDDAHRLYDKVQEKTEQYLKGSLEGEVGLLNSLGWERLVWCNGTLHSLPPLSLSSPSETQTPISDKVRLERLPGGHICLKNGRLEAIIEPAGRIRHLRLISQKSGTLESVAEGQLSNQFTLFDDVPLYWDAWDVMDYHLETRQALSEVTSPLSPTSDGSDAERTVEFSLKVSEKSRITQRITMKAAQSFLEMSTTVDWDEAHKLLKVEFPCNVRPDPTASFEIQFGHVSRPAHRNTSWDAAKFEVCGHKWVDLSEAGFGVALLNDSKYGFNAAGNVLSMSLLRSPKAPDATADVGRHVFRYALLPHQGAVDNVIRAAYEFNSPPREVRTPDFFGSLLTSSHPAVIVEAVKVSEDGRGLILRLYEAFGGQAVTELQLHPRVTMVREVNFLENDVATTLSLQKCQLSLKFKAFQIRSLYLGL